MENFCIVKQNKNVKYQRRNHLLVATLDSESSVLYLRRHVGATNRVADLLAVLGPEAFASRTSTRLVDVTFDVFSVGVVQEKVVDFFDRSEVARREYVFPGFGVLKLLFFCRSLSGK